uniref:Protein CLP1 homolog n=1 Tax=Eutreptiella gymnastica TaxID=73025 RepID=A0A7S4LQ01_9EUGL
MELRFEVSQNEESLLKLTQGQHEHAEIFGTELASERVYAFPAGAKVAVWTWHGCHVQLEDCKEVYPHKWEENAEIPMHKYASIHLRLADMRRLAKEQQTRGPRVMICGPQGSGKNALCKLLMNYAARQENCLLYADLDPAQNDIVPGCVAAVAIVQPISIEDKFSLLAPLGYFVGETDCTANSELYKQMCSNLAQTVSQRAMSPGNEELKYGGVVINTSGLVAEKHVDLLVEAIKDFDVDHVFIMDDEKLTASLTTKFKPAAGTNDPVTNQNGTALHIEKIVKSGGVVPRNPEVRKQEMGWLIKEYFYGSRCQPGGISLNPHRLTVPFADVRIVRIGGHKVKSYMLPAGQASVLDPCQVSMVEPAEELQHRLGGLSFARTEKELLTSNIVGLLWIQAVDMDNKKFTLLLPSPVASNQLPGKYIVVGNMNWLDS